MATRKKIVEIITCIKNTYMQYTNGVNVEALVNTWELLLKDYPDKAVEVAFYKCLQTCEKPPLPAHIIQELNTMAEALEASDEELWSLYTKALNKTEREVYYFRFTFVEDNGKTQGDNAKARVQELWDSLPERLKQYIGSKGELIRIARDYTAEDMKYEKNRFFKMMPTMKKREEAAKIVLLLGNDKLLIE